MAKQLKDILKGVKASKIEKGSLGVDPGVDYDPKAGDEQRFVAKHATEKHADRNGNDEKIYNADQVKYDLNFKDEKRHGRKKGDDKKVYEAREAEDATCNESKKGVRCPVHGLAECWSAKKINEGEDDEREAGQSYSKDTTSPSAGKASNKMKQDTVSSGTDAGNKSKNSSKADEPSKPAKPSAMAEANDDEDFVVSRAKDARSKMNAATDPDEKEKYKKQHDAILSTVNRIPSNVKEEVELDEVLGKDQPAGEWIKDFVDSDNPKFEGKSKKKRTEMALAAYYSKQREKKS